MTEKSEESMDLLQEVSGAKRIGISGHVRPDGDCVGSGANVCENACTCSARPLFLKLQSRINNICMGRLAEPKDIAGACMFMLSDLSEYVSGQILAVDGCTIM